MMIWTGYFVIFRARKTDWTLEGSTLRTQADGHTSPCAQGFPAMILRERGDKGEVWYKPHVRLYVHVQEHKDPQGNKEKNMVFPFSISVVNFRHLV